jgi:hypothetical protein
MKFSTLKKAGALFIFILSITSFVAYKSGYFSKNASVKGNNQPVSFQNSLVVNYVDSPPPPQKDFISSSKSIILTPDSTLLKLKNLIYKKYEPSDSVLELMSSSKTDSILVVNQTKRQQEVAESLFMLISSSKSMVIINDLDLSVFFDSLKFETGSKLKTDTAKSK